MLPILVLDQQVLKPQLGFWFDRKWIDPCESLVTILWKFARANRVPGHVLARIVCGNEIDPYAGVVPQWDTVVWRWLCRDHRIPYKALRESLVGKARAYALRPDLSYCLPCLRRGYHATIFQLSRVTRCPIHGRRLTEACPACGHRIPLRLNALLLDNPYVCPGCRGKLAGSIPSLVRYRPMSREARILICTRRFDLALA